jgi:hypothetical protein
MLGKEVSGHGLCRLSIQSRSNTYRPLGLGAEGSYTNSCRIEAFAGSHLPMEYPAFGDGDGARTIDTGENTCDYRGIF